MTQFSEPHHARDQRAGVDLCAHGTCGDQVEGPKEPFLGRFFDVFGGHELGGFGCLRGLFGAGERDGSDWVDDWVGSWVCGFYWLVRCWAACLAVFPWFGRACLARAWSAYPIIQ